MKKNSYFLSAILFLISAAALPLGAQQSLGDIARQVRMSKPAPAATERVYTNDNLPTNSGLGVASVTSSAPAADTSTASAAAVSSDNSSATAATAATAPAAEQSDKDRQKMYDDWKQKIQGQKDQISLLERELSVLQREAQIRGAVFYADAGTQLRDQKAYADAVRKNQEDTDAKQKELTDAKQKLDDMQEQARKAGVPSSYY